MENKKKFYAYLIMMILTIALIVTTLFVPIVSAVSRTMDMHEEVIPEASGTFNLFGFTSAMAYLFGASYDADGPVWLSILGVTLNWLILAFTIVLLGFLIFELCTVKKCKMLMKQNLFTKRLALIVGYFGASVAIFEIVAFLVTTALAEGFFVYSFQAQVIISAVLSIGILLCAYLSGKRTKEEQKPNKIRDGISFALTAMFGAMFLICVFVPSTFDRSSFWGISGLASEITYPVAAEYFVGIMRWTTLALFVPLAFILVYCVIGFIRSLQRKGTNWLSGAVKRWTMAWLILCIVYIFLMTATTIAVYGYIWFDGVFVVSPAIFLSIILIIIPYFLATNIALNKKRKN